MSYYVTTPIYHVNGQPHLGHAYTTIAADVLARHMRQRGEDVFFLTGTDEHGEPVMPQAAERLGITPRELGDRNAGRFRELASKLNVTNDFFIRTTDPEHAQMVAEVVQRILHDNGHVYDGHLRGLVLPSLRRLQDRVGAGGGGNRRPIYKIELEMESEDNWFFRLSTFQEPLERLYAEQPGLRDSQEPLQRGRSPSSGGGLRDLTLSRGRLRWRLPVPWDLSQVIYVWIDALLNYLLRALLRAPRRGSQRALLAGHRPPDRQGHPQVPRRDLAGHADGGGYRGAPPGGHPRLSAAGREDVQIARQRDRAVPGGGPLRARRCASTSCARSGSARTARSPEGFETRYTTELANEYGNLARGPSR